MKSRDSSDDWHMQTKPIIRFLIIDDHDLYLIFLHTPCGVPSFSFRFGGFTSRFAVPVPQNVGIISQLRWFVYSKWANYTGSRKQGRR